MSFEDLFKKLYLVADTPPGDKEREKIVREAKSQIQKDAESLRFRGKPAPSFHEPRSKRIRGTEVETREGWLHKFEGTQEKHDDEFAEQRGPDLIEEPGKSLPNKEISK